MAKVIVERPRYNRGLGFPRASSVEGKRLAIEELPFRNGIRRAWRNERQKELNENLAPLRRFLRTNIGRPWNKVYSEICQRINRDSAVQLHVWQHLMQDVCRDPYVISGDVGRTRWGRRWFLFYVDPRSGLLRENDARKRTVPIPKPKETDRIKIDDKRECRKLEGIWYELDLSPIPSGPPVYDQALRRSSDQISRDERWNFYGRSVYAVSKRQLNSREIRRLATKQK